MFLRTVVLVLTSSQLCILACPLLATTQKCTTAQESLQVGRLSVNCHINKVSSMILIHADSLIQAYKYVQCCTNGMQLNTFLIFFSNSSTPLPIIPLNLKLCFQNILMHTHSNSVRGGSGSE